MRTARLPRPRRASGAEVLQADPQPATSSAALERAQAIAGHESPRTTQLYDRTADDITVEDIERIKV